MRSSSKSIARSPAYSSPSIWSLFRFCWRRRSCACSVSARGSGAISSIRDLCSRFSPLWRHPTCLACSSICAATLALAPWLFALGAWLSLSYVSFGVLTILNTERGTNIIHGGWLIAIVGAQSLVILGTRIAPLAHDLSDAIFVLIHMLWGIGLALYGIFIVLFAQRIFFADIETDDLSPVLWVVMGAAAISANAGSTLLLTGSHVAFLQSIRPFVEGVTLILWAWGTWCIPLLLLFGVWKHMVRRAAVAYTPLFWSLVFPLGMYALASLRLSLVMEFPPLAVISAAMIWVALAAWAVTALGLAQQTWRAAAAHSR